MTEELKEVYFYPYCSKCAHKDKAEYEEPCNDCLENPANSFSHKPIRFEGTRTEVNPGYFTKIKRIKEYLYETKYNYLDYPNAYRYYKTMKDIPQIAGCSSVRNGKYYGRNLDWTYNDQAEFVVKVPRISNHYASIGVSGGFSVLTESFVKNGAESDIYKIVPFQIYDGINEWGLTANVNVVPRDIGSNIGKPTVSRRDSVNGLMLIRYILDRFQTASEAVNYIHDYVEVYFPKAIHEYGYEFHYMIADQHDTYVLEFVNDRAYFKEINDAPYLTNFYIYNVVFADNGTVLTPETQYEDFNAMTVNRITKRGSGLERYNYLVNNYDRTGNLDGMMEVMSELLYSRAYPTYYNPADPFWYTEFVGSRNLTCASDVLDYLPVVNAAGEYYADRTREDGKTWQTVHSSVYDMRSKRLYLKTQEADQVFSFEIDK